MLRVQCVFKDTQLEHNTHERNAPPGSTVCCVSMERHLYLSSLLETTYSAIWLKYQSEVALIHREQLPVVTDKKTLDLSRVSTIRICVATSHHARPSRIGPSDQPWRLNNFSA